MLLFLSKHKYRCLRLFAFSATAFLLRLQPSQATISNFSSHSFSDRKPPLANCASLYQSSSPAYIDGISPSAHASLSTPLVPASIFQL
ncbi:hypothetical protein V8C26DRAFT_9374 [Trichoderma gracile]